MSRRCERPGCSAPATVAYGFAADRQLAWLADLGEDRTASGALCEAHAEAMVLPRGWWLDDRRTDEPTLFRAREHRPTATERRAAGDEPRRRRESRRAHELVIGEQLALDAGVVPPAALETADTAELDDGDPADLGEDADEAAVAAAEEAPVGPPLVAPDVAVEPWTPTFDVADDLGGLLDASTPLLARAFGRRRSTTGPADRG
jgi:Protein of unknown function (DUF3499)